MATNIVEGCRLPEVQGGPYDIIDVPGQGYFKNELIENLPNSQIVIVLVDSTDRQSISASAEFIYDILNSDRYDEASTPLIVTCSKQDLKFAKSKKIIEAELTNEVENIKSIKQKNNLEESTQLGTLYSMKNKFSFKIFKNIHFVETDKSSSYSSLIKTIKELI